MSEQRMARRRADAGPARAATRVVAGWGRLEAHLAARYGEYLRSRAARVITRPVLVTFFGLLALSRGAQLREFVGATEEWGLAAWAVAAYQALTLAFLLLTVALLAARRPARRPVRRIIGWAVALAGTFLPSLLIADPARGIDAPLAAPAAACLVGGMALATWSLATLGRNLSILPEARGLVRDGPYRRVRHPLYLGEMVATLGVLLPVLTARNAAIFAAFCALQVWRTRYEEEALAATFPEYDAYRRRTARILPGLI